MASGRNEVRSNLVYVWYVYQAATMARVNYLLERGASDGY
jgi:hypothetical protein